jgi:TPR repeat protein/serine/threonine protein kinase
MPSLPSASQGITQSLPTGTRLEEFVIERVLGTGGFGITYLARDSSLGRRVVIKENLPSQFCWRDSHALTVRPRHTEGEDADNFQYSLESFRNEAATLASLDHPGIVRVLRSFEAYGTAYFVMPFVEGTALDEQIRARQDSGQDFTEDEVGGMLWRVLDALAYLHDRGIYHRDIKPGNILITATGEPVLIDFGAARQRLSERSLTVIESAGYTPFEQLQTRGKVGPWSDIYALGGTLYKALTGETPAKAADRIMDDPLVPLAERPEIRARYSSRLLKSIDKAIAPKAADRFQDAGQWRDWVWKSTSHASPEPVREEPLVAETAQCPTQDVPSTPHDLPFMSAVSNRLRPAIPQSFERAPRPESQQPPLPRSKVKKTSVTSMLAVVAIVIAVFGTVAYLLMPSARTPEGWDPRAASSEEVDRYAAAGVLDAQIEQVARVLGIPGSPPSSLNPSAEDLARAFNQVKALAAKGHPRSMNVLGVCYAFGKGVVKDDAEAVKWYLKAAEAGEAIAMTNVGINYATGIGVTQDANESVRWFRKAAERGDARGMWYLGLACSSGNGLSKDENEAAKWYQRAADLGDLFAMNSLGVAFEHGIGVTKNPVQAVSWYRKAAANGNEVAMNNLGDCYADGVGVQADAAEAVKWYQRAADSGSLAAMNSLGVALEYGSGIAKDPAGAVKWYREAAEAGNGVSMTNLGRCYADGRGLSKDEFEAVLWFRKASEAGNTYGMCKLGGALMTGMGVSKNETEAATWFRKAADLGDATAMTTLGECYQSGSGVQKDLGEALAWFRKAAACGDATGMFHVGYAYGTAAGVQRDDTEAMKWFRMAADKGHVSSMYNLGVGSEFGLGMAKNEVEAVNWYRKAAEAGSEGAMSSLGRCYEIGIGLPKDEVQAVNWFRKAAEAGDARGMFLLGSSYLSGSGVPKDDAAALTWYHKAAEAGDASAMGSLGWCFANGIGVNKDIGTAAHWYRQAAVAGNAIAMYEFGNCYRIGAGVPKDSHQAIEWFAKSAEGEDLHLASKMQSLIFPQVNFQNATVEEAVEYMIVKSRDLDANKEAGIRSGVMIIIAEMTFKQSNASLSLDLKNVPMSEALRYIAELSGMKLRIEPQVVLLTPAS